MPDNQSKQPSAIQSLFGRLLGSNRTPEERVRHLDAALRHWAEDQNPCSFHSGLVGDWTTPRVDLSEVIEEK